MSTLTLTGSQAEKLEGIDPGEAVTVNVTARLVSRSETVGSVTVDLGIEELTVEGVKDYAGAVKQARVALRIEPSIG
jgi:hypothetical protein